MIKPTKGLIVEPVIVIASPMPGIKRPIRQQQETIAREVKKFYLGVIPYSFQKSSSTVSLAGKTQIGAAAKTANRIPKFAYRDKIVEVILW